MKPVENCDPEIVCVVVTRREDWTAKGTDLHSAVRGALAVQQ
jgi:hypothetical protein